MGVGTSAGETNRNPRIIHLWVLAEARGSTRFRTNSPGPVKAFRTLYPAMINSFSEGIFAICNLSIFM